MCPHVHCSSIIAKIRKQPKRPLMDKGIKKMSYTQMEKEMATHSSVLAWRIPGMGEPGGLPSMGSHRVGHN